MVETQWTRSVECTDPFGRHRSVTVFVKAGESIGLQAPPGETALIDPSLIEALKQALTDALVVAVRGEPA
jgi:hypothetical protein